MPLGGPGYLRPGAYIGQIVRPAPAGLPDLPRLPCVIGRGDRLARGRNLGLLRSFIFDEELSFTPVAPYRADLQFDSDQDKEDPSVELVDASGTAVPKNKWYFVDADTVEINPNTFDPNTTYYLDYQSSERTSLDPIPVDDIRGSVKIGIGQDIDEFEEFVDFFIPMTMAASGQPAGVLGATLSTPPGAPIITAPAGDVGNDANAPVITASGDTAYSHAYSRSYTIVVENAGAFTFRWTSSPISGGNSAEPHNPLDPAQTAEWTTFVGDNPAGGNANSDFTLEYGLKVNVAVLVGVTSYVNGDSWTFTAVGTQRVEIDQRHLNTNQFLDMTLTSNAGNTGTTDPTLNRVTSTYTGEHVLKWRFEALADSAGLAGARTVSIMWSLYGTHESVLAAGVANLDEAVTTIITLTPAGASIKLDFGDLADIDNGDVWDLVVSPPRIFTKVRDDRTYTLLVTGVDNAAPSVSGSFLTNTVEGRFGGFSATPTGFVNIDATPAVTTGLPDDVRLHVRNMEATAPLFQYEVGDKFAFTITNQDVIDWSLVSRITQVIPTDDWKFDPSGRITGTLNSWYAILQKTPTNIEIVHDGTDEVAHAQVTGTAYIYVTTGQPSGNTTVVYDWRGGEPAPGQTYHLTANYIRTDDLLNTPILVQTREDAINLLAPMTADNDVLQHALAVLYSGGPGVYVCQVKDQDDDLGYTDADYSDAILEAENVTAITDLIVAERWGVLGDMLSSVDRMNEPRERKRRLAWAGAPQNTAIGDAETADTLVYYASRTLQVYGDSPSHGTRILHGATWCKHTIRLDSGQTKQVTKSGSLVSALLAGMVSAFDAPWESIIRRTFGFFDEVQTYTEAEEATLGGSQIIYFSDLGAGVFRVEEDFTTDNFAEQYRYVNTMTQQHYMSRFVEKEVDSAIGLVPPSQPDGADIVKGLVVNALRKALASGLIADYLTDAGAVRGLNPDSDVIAFADPGERVAVQFRFTYFLRYILKKALGLYSVDGGDFDV